jgi:FkbM family methyltransferase
MILGWIKNMSKRILYKIKMMLAIQAPTNDSYKWLQAIEIDTIVDVGSSNGGFVRKIRPVFPLAKIYCFEPVQVSFHELLDKTKLDNNLQAFNYGLCHKSGTATFYLSSRIGSSSLLAMTNLHKIVYPSSAQITTTSIDVKRLDEVKELKLGNHNMLKLDVQGAELLVLQGASNILSQFEIVFTEVNFATLYSENATLSNLALYLSNYNFEICGIENISRSHIDGTYLQADVYFVNKNKINK